MKTIDMVLSRKAMAYGVCLICLITMIPLLRTPLLFDDTSIVAKDAVVAAADEDATGVFDFTLPANGLWHWLRVRNAEDDAEAADAFSLWLRLK